MIVATGASLTAVMLMVDVAVETRAPPVPVLPLSLTDRVSVEVADGVSDAELEEIASSLLANTVIEDWKVVRVDTAEAAS